MNAEQKTSNTRKRIFCWRPRIEPLEDRLALSATLEDAGISQRVIDLIDNLPWADEVLNDSILTNTLDALVSSQTAPANATLLTSVGDLSQITAGTVANPNVFLIQGNLTITDNIEVPSNVEIYVDGSIYKAGSHTRSPGSASENANDVLFRVTNRQNVKLIGVNDALLHSRNTLNDQQGHATAVYVTGNATDNVLVEGFEIANVWEGLVARGNPRNVTFMNNYVHDTLKRAIWHLTTTDSVAVHNFLENAGADGMDWDAFVDSSMGYENVVIGAGRWLGFVEEAAHDSYFVRNLGIMADFGNPNADLYYQLGWADHGTTQGVYNSSGQVTRDNYFIDNVVFRPTTFNEGGDYFANQPPKGMSYFWANRGYGAGQSTDPNRWINAEWLDYIPTAGGAGNAVNGVQLLIDLDAMYNTATGIRLAAPDMSISELAPIGAVVGSVVALNADIEDLTFGITAGNDGNAFAIDNDGVITVTNPLSFQAQSSYLLSIEATDGDLIGNVAVEITVDSLLETTVTVFDHDFRAPEFFDASDVRGQQGWAGQGGWAVHDAAGHGYATSDTTDYQGVTNDQQGDVAVGDNIKLTIDFDMVLAIDTNSDQFRFGVTTLNDTGQWVPSLGNNGGDLLSGKVEYEEASPPAANSGSLKFWLDEKQASDDANAIVVEGLDVGLDVSQGDGQTDGLRLIWNATKLDSANQWEITLTVHNLTTATELGEKSIAVVDSGTYGTTTGLFGGFRGLANLSQTTFNIDRCAYQIITPMATIDGDYNLNGIVDAADFTVWRDTLGSTTDLRADGSGNDIVDQADYEIWSANFGNTVVPVSPPNGLAGPTALSSDSQVTLRATAAPPNASQPPAVDMERSPIRRETVDAMVAESRPSRQAEPYQEDAGQDWQAAVDVSLADYFDMEL